MYKLKIIKIAVANLQQVKKTAQKQIIKKIEELKDEPTLSRRQLTGLLKNYRSFRAVGQRYGVTSKIVED